MYYYGGGQSCGCGNYNMPYQTCPQFSGCGCQTGNGTSSYAIVLVLFILLVIVIGSRWAR